MTSRDRTGGISTSSGCQIPAQTIRLFFGLALPAECGARNGDGEVVLEEIMRIVKKVKYMGWINIDHHYARVSPRHSFDRCMKYIREKLDPIYS